MEDEIEQPTIPGCPYCENSQGDCEHVLLNYDATFNEYISGYLANDFEQIEHLKRSIWNLINSNISPTLGEGYIKDIWDYAIDNYDSEFQEIDLDMTSYFNLLDQIIDLYGGEAHHYEESDGAPGYSSTFIIFFASDPLQTISEINSSIVSEFI